MFAFMEGLPRAGKSYETCAYYIVPALLKGRTVVAYIEGLNHDKFAEVTGLPITIIKKLLIPITVEQVPEIYKYAVKDSLVIIDEMQDHWPSTRQPLGPEITTFITQHGHDGLDIIGMGQDLTDIHKLWRNRCARKIIFQKLDGVGRDGNYAWSSYSAVRGKTAISFRKIRSGVRKYEEKYFGLYKSHTAGTTNFDTFSDDRTNIFKGSVFRYTIPIFAVLAVFAVYKVSGIFSGEDLPVSAVNATEVSQNSDFAALESQFQSMPASPSKTVNAVDPVPVVSSDYVVGIASEYKLRLAGYIKTAKGVFYEVQAYDSTMHLKERFTGVELASLGWNVELTDHGLVITKEDYEYLVRSWPIDTYGKLSNKNIQSAQL